MACREAAALLGVACGASKAAVESAFRRRALRCHPDRHPKDALAKTRFLRLSRAKELLLAQAQPEARPRAPRAEPRAAPRATAAEAERRREEQKRREEKLKKREAMERARQKEKEVWSHICTYIRQYIFYHCHF